MDKYLTLQELKNIIVQFEQGLEGYSYKTFIINEKEKVFVIEDSLVLYVGFVTYLEDWYGKCNSIYNKESEYRLKIEELTYNNIDFRFDESDFNKKCRQIIGQEFYCLYFKFFRAKESTIIYTFLPASQGLTPKNVEKPPLIEPINLLIPDIKIKERNDNWNGITYYFIIVEVLGADNKKGSGVYWTTSLPYTYMMGKCRRWLKEGCTAGNFNAVGNGFEEAFVSWRGSGLRRKFILENKLTYFFIKKDVKDKNKLYEIAYDIYNNTQKNIYKDIERNTFINPVNKWKTEELVYHLVKKIYKNYKVIYQHRPFFLKSTKGGQMSYDIFITGLNIAIEYQGKQHFEPVDFFGGLKNYKCTVARDKLKKELSKKNGVKLIYINYWENVTSSLIVEKINKVLNEKQL